MLRAVLVGVLREVGRGLRPCKPKGRTSAGEGRTEPSSPIAMGLTVGKLFQRGEALPRGVGSMRRAFLVCVALVLMSATVGVGIAEAAACRKTLTVNDAGDSGVPGQLRAAIADVCDGARSCSVPAWSSISSRESW